MKERLKSNPGTFSWCSGFCLLMSEAFLPNLESFPTLVCRWCSLIFLDSRYEKWKQQSLPLQECTFYCILSTSIFLFFILHSLIPELTYCKASLLFSKNTAEGGEGEPASLEHTKPKACCSIFMINVNFTNRQVLHFKWINRVVSRYKISTNQVEGTENTKFHLIKFKKLERVQFKNILSLGHGISLDYWPFDFWFS